MGVMEEVQLHLVESMEEAAAFGDWLSQQTVIAFDLETSGVDPYNDSIRLLQVSNDEEAWALPYYWLGAAKEYLEKYRGVTIGHNMAFDYTFAQQFGFELFPNASMMHDTMLMAKSIDPNMPAGLKPLSAKFIDPQADVGEIELKRVMKENGWGWDTIPVTTPEYWIYGCLDVIFTYRLARFFQELMNEEERFLLTYELEMDILPIFVEMRTTGVKVNRAKAKKLHNELDLQVTEMYSDFIHTYGFSPSSTSELGDYLLSEGVEFEKFTATGQPSLTKEVLETIDHPCAQAVRDYREVAKMKTAYVGNMLEYSERDGKLHPEFRQAEARTGRSCLPTDSYRVLTDKGVVTWDQVQVGDKTVGRSGWTTVKAVHHYDDAFVFGFGHTRFEYECTPEHRWLMGDGELRSVLDGYIGKSSRPGEPETQALVVTPADADQLIWDHKPTGDYARLGWLLTDATLALDKNGHFRARIMQQEGNHDYLGEIVDLFDGMIGSVSEPGTDGMVRVSIKAPEAKRMLRSLGITWQDTGAPNTKLKEFPDQILRCLYDANDEELKSFFAACYHADGRKGQHNIEAQAVGVRYAIQYAGYRLGWTSRVGRYRKTRSDGSQFEHSTVLFKPGRFHGHNTWTTSARNTEVFCLETEDGTWTAWNDGPILTGNSVSKPALQQIPTPPEDDEDETALTEAAGKVRSLMVPDAGNVFVSCDYSQQELRILAHLTGDQGLIDAVQGDEDAFVVIGRHMYPDNPLKDKSDPRRSSLKMATYALMYGVGDRKLGEQLGVTTEEAKELKATMFDTFPGLKSFMNDTVQEMKTLSRSGKKPQTWSEYGRSLVTDPDYEYKATNYIIQGTAADMLKHALRNLYNNGYGPYLRLVIHDEILLEIPKSMDTPEVLEEIEKLMEQAAPEHMFPGVTFPAEAVVGKDFSECK